MCLFPESKDTACLVKSRCSKSNLYSVHKKMCTLKHTFAPVFFFFPRMWNKFIRAAVTLSEGRCCSLWTGVTSEPQVAVPRAATSVSGPCLEPKWFLLIISIQFVHIRYKYLHPGIYFGLIRISTLSFMVLKSRKENCRNYGFSFLCLLKMLSFLFIY